MKAPSIEHIVNYMFIRDYRVFSDPDGYDLNIIGIRANEAKANRFDDLIVVFHKFGFQWSVNYFPATTDPGKYWLENPMNSLGTAIMKPGQYLGAYKIGKHKDTYRALVQRKPITFYRDNDKDSELDFDGREQTGLIGANIHCAGWERISVMVDKWSAGCQVIASWYDFMVFMDICEAARKAFGNSFSYTLIEEKALI